MTIGSPHSLPPLLPPFTRGLWGGLAGRSEREHGQQRTLVGEHQTRAECVHLTSASEARRGEPPFLHPCCGDVVQPVAQALLRAWGAGLLSQTSSPPLSRRQQDFDFAPC